MTRRHPITIGPRTALIALLIVGALMSFAGWADAEHELAPINQTAEGCANVQC